MGDRLQVPEVGDQVWGKARSNAADHGYVVGCVLDGFGAWCGGWFLAGGITSTITPGRIAWGWAME
jgi:hypothetical protein